MYKVHTTPPPPPPPTHLVQLDTPRHLTLKSLNLSIRPCHDNVMAESLQQENILHTHACTHTHTHAHTHTHTHTRTHTHRSCAGTLKSCWRARVHTHTHTHKYITINCAWQQEMGRVKIEKTNKKVLPTNPEQRICTSTRPWGSWISFSRGLLKSVCSMCLYVRRRIHVSYEAQEEEDTCVI
jgi:hypothetical protein